MSSPTIAVFDTKPYDSKFLDNANKHYNFSLKYFETHLNNKTAILANGSEVACAFVNDIIDKKVIKTFQSIGVKLIALRCAGFNNVDIKAAYNAISIVHVPAYSPYAVAEYTVSLILCLNRKIYKSYYRSRVGNFSIQGLMGFDMHGKTAGIIGTGRIGKRAIAILKGFGMNILANDAFPDKEFEKTSGIHYVSLPELYKNSDIISLHCPLIPETKYLINEKSITLMKDGVMIINTGRGELIKTKALIDGLKTRKIGAAGLDVYEEESKYFFEDFSVSLISDDVLARLLTFPNVLITSHQGFFTEEAVSNIAKTTLYNISQFFKGESLENEIIYKP